MRYRLLHLPSPFSGGDPDGVIYQIELRQAGLPLGSTGEVIHSGYFAGGVANLLGTSAEKLGCVLEDHFDYDPSLPDELQPTVVMVVQRHDGSWDPAGDFDLTTGCVLYTQEAV